MSTITKERIELFIKNPLENGLTRGEQMELARIALASLEAEPVAWLLSGGGAKNNVSFDSGNAYADPLREVTPLYTAPPAPVSVPAAMEIDDDFDSAFEHGKAVGWNAYRAAMLQAEPVSNSDELPLDYLQGHKDGLEWAAQLAEANHPQTGDWLYDDPIDLARAIRKGPDMPTVKESDMTTISRERIEQYVNDPRMCNVNDEIRQIARIALASLEREQIRHEHAKWSDSTFGCVGPIGPLKHLSKEALEAAAEPDDLSEWADMQFLLWDAQRRAGISDAEITAAMENKLKINMERQWPEPKDGEPRLHIKEPGNSPVTPDAWISCSARMPAQDDWILIYSKHGEYMAGQVQGEYVELSDGTLSWLGNALFWTPLPEPPQEVNRG